MTTIMTTTMTMVKTMSMPNNFQNRYCNCDHAKDRTGNNYRYYDHTQAVTDRKF